MPPGPPFLIVVGLKWAKFQFRSNFAFRQGVAGLQLLEATSARARKITGFCDFGKVIGSGGRVGGEGG